MRVNNVDIQKLENVVGEFQADPSKAKRVNRIEGTWNLDEGAPQFMSTVKFEGDQVTFEADQPTFLGGGSTRPGPMHYCLYGLASCYTATFATTAAMQGVALRRLGVVAEMNVNFSRVFGLSDEPIVEGIKVTLTVDADASKEELEQLEQAAYERCPVVFTLRNVIPLKVEVQKCGA